MVAEANRLNSLAVAAVGTAGLRIAGNGTEVVAAIRSRTGLAIEVISGEEEGRLAYLAARVGLGLGAGSLVVFDSGGGSSQFTFGEGTHVADQFSVNVGGVEYTERFGLSAAVSEAVLAEAVRAISADLVSIESRGSPDALVGMGGTLTNIAAVHHELTTYDADVVQGTVLDRSELDRQIELYRSLDANGRRSIVGLQPKRADVILAGALIVRSVMDKLHQKALTVSDRGLRHGLIAERFGTPGAA
jgi:exopolyphosphatase/guanosine-5'-triphosphate,3'-diphosphate pyrophosphatase